MNMQELRSMARELNIKPLPASKLQLVRAIQNGEGNFPCFATAINGECDQPGCLWREDCFKLSKTEKPSHH